LKIFVGNLDWNATESGLRGLFEQYGTVDQVHVVTERETGRSRGFAFVEMGDSAQAEQAIRALNGREFEGRTLNVNEARPKTESGPRREGGGQRRGPRW
jgi:RNA recognition motif-containing protein